VKNRKPNQTKPGILQAKRQMGNEERYSKRGPRKRARRIWEKSGGLLEMRPEQP